MALLEYEPQQLLYHYCGPAGFEGILKSKVLWFHDLTQMNDPRELELGFEHFFEALTSVRHDEYQGHRGFFLSILAGRLAGLRESHQAFCCCFSLAGDELPLWSEYTGYSGLSIGFKPTAVKNIKQGSRRPTICPTRPGRRIVRRSSRSPRFTIPTARVMTKGFGRTPLSPPSQPSRH
ncbi:hypothetical protein LZK80_09825 [Rhizobium leguminosarum]|nr:hypothetical protein LZK80_09825 [Rhizobium leguminosarum]